MAPGQEEDNMAHIERMVADVDLDSNGEISFDEFCDSPGLLEDIGSEQHRKAIYRHIYIHMIDIFDYICFHLDYDMSTYIYIYTSKMYHRLFVCWLSEAS